jgi:hypothetical protein
VEVAGGVAEQLGEGRHVGAEWRAIEMEPCTVPNKMHEAQPRAGGLVFNPHMILSI